MNNPQSLIHLPLGEYPQRSYFIAQTGTVNAQLMLSGWNSKKPTEGVSTMTDRENNKG